MDWLPAIGFQSDSGLFNILTFQLQTAIKWTFVWPKPLDYLIFHAGDDAELKLRQKFSYVWWRGEANAKTLHNEINQANTES